MSFSLLDPHLGLHYRFKYEVLAASMDPDDPWPHAEEAEKALRILKEDIEDNPDEDEAYQKESLEVLKNLHKDLEILKEDLREYEKGEAAEEPAKEQPNRVGEAVEAKSSTAAVHEEQVSTKVDKRGRGLDSDEDRFIKKGKK
ncbi:hypothetical protein BKA80DRAFT_313250 [Phyllosticta citrichinensis]